MIFADHPGITGARRLAALEESFWTPLKGLIPKIVDLGLGVDAAAQVLRTGIPSGRIGHRTKPSTDQAPFFAVLNARGAELVRQSGFDYEAGINWRTGRITVDGEEGAAVEVFWPDVERAALSTPSIGEHTPALHKRGPRPSVRLQVEASMRQALADGTMTPASLANLKKKELPPQFGAAETTCADARKAVLKTSTNSDRTPTNDK